MWTLLISKILGSIEIGLQIGEQKDISNATKEYSRQNFVNFTGFQRQSREDFDKLGLTVDKAVNDTFTNM